MKLHARPRGRTMLNALVLLAGCLISITVTSGVATQQARADTVPPPPAGWTTVFGDNFAGPAGSAPSSANWFYDIGTGFGTGEIEHMTSSTANSYLDGNGHLVLKAINSGGTWTSGRLESTRDDFAAPVGGKLEMTASIEQPNPANGLGYWPAFWALGSPMRAGGGWPQSGEIDMMEDVNALNEASQTLHDSANSPGHPLIACPAAGSTCQTGYHTYSVIIDRTNTSAEFMQFLMDGTVESTITEASVGTAAWQAAIDHGFFIMWDLAMGGNYPNGICNCTTPTSATTSGASMSVAYVAVYEEGGNTTPTATPTGTGSVTGINGLCLTNQNSLNTEGNPMFVSACNGSAGQVWSPYTDSTLRTEGGCLDVNAAGTAPGTAVKWYPCNGTVAQNWTHQANGELVNPHSGLCLTDPGNNTATALDIDTCTGASGQIWTLPSSTGNTVTVTNPGNQTSTVGTAVSLQIHATDSASGQTLTYSATGLPAGLSVNSSTGLISGTPTATGTSNVTVTATDTTGAKGNASFTWTVNPAGSNTVTVTNPGSQSWTVGTAVSLQIHATDSASGQTLTYTATGLPAGLSINASTGLITGTPTTASSGSATVTAKDSTGASGLATFNWTVNTAGNGEPPPAFWGNTSAIPAATHVLEFSIVNQTNGQYPDSQVYWSFGGQTKSIAQQPYIDMPANSAGRMYFYLGTPNGPYYDFIEFTVGASSINIDTTRVDRFGLKIAMLLHGHDGSNQEIGENYATFTESRSATFTRFQNFVPTEFKELATDNAPYGIPSPGNDKAFQTGGAYANYFTSYAAANGDTSDSTAQVFGCGGTLAGNPQLCAALNRHVAGETTAQQQNPANFYLAAPANYYAEFWHQNAINGKQYGFPYDDYAGQSSDISLANPQYCVVAIGW